MSPTRLARGSWKKLRAPGCHSELAPRGWGEIAVASLLALNDPGLDSLVTAYCQDSAGS